MCRYVEVFDPCECKPRGAVEAEAKLAEQAAAAAAAAGGGEAGAAAAAAAEPFVFDDALRQKVNKVGLYR